MLFTIEQPRTTDDALAWLAGASTGLGSPTAERIVTTEHLTDSFQRGTRKPTWVWVARRDDRIVSRVAAWGPGDSGTPGLIDLVDVGTEPDRVDVTAQLLRGAARGFRELGSDEVEQIVFAPTTWRDDPPAALTDLLAASDQAGFEVLVTRRRYAWTPKTALPGAPAALRLTGVGGVDDPALRDAYQRTFAGTLDAHTRRSLRSRSAAEIAGEDLAAMATFNGPVEGWRLAHDESGALVGLVVGTRGERALIGFVGVVPEQRGHRYARQLVTAMVREQAEAGASIVIGETDDENLPMANAFEKAGFRQESARIDLVA